MRAPRTSPTDHPRRPNCDQCDALIGPGAGRAPAYRVDHPTSNPKRARAEYLCGSCAGVLTG